MEKKRILIISGGMFPNNSPRAFRTTELVKELGHLGHDVTLIIPFKNYDYSLFEKEHNVKIKFLRKRILPAVPSSKDGKERIVNRAIRRLLLLLFEYPAIELMPLVRKALSKEKDYDLLISIAVPFPLHWGVAWSKTKKHPIASTWVADCGDPYMGNTMDSFQKFFYFKYLEKWFCRKADFISVPADDYIQYYYSEFKPKIIVIPQGFKFSDSKLYNGKIENPVPTFAFAGRFLPNIRDPRPFLDYLITLECDFRFVVFAPYSELVEPYKVRLGSKLELRGFIPREDLMYELSTMDFLVNIEFEASVKSNSPSKFADYIIANRPVLSLNMADLDTIKINEFLSGNYSNKLIIKDPDRFRIENVVNQFISLIK
jgi:hypothetical protein